MSESVSDLVMFCTRVPPDLRDDVRRVANKYCVSVQQFVKNALEAELAMVHELDLEEGYE